MNNNLLMKKRAFAKRKLLQNLLAFQALDMTLLDEDNRQPPENNF